MNEGGQLKVPAASFLIFLVGNSWVL